MLKEKIKTYLLQLILFVITLGTTSAAGAQFQGYADLSSEALLQGLWFSLPFLGILTVHEFGHYITAKLYKADVTLPYYIPFITLLGTLGAFIRIKSRLKTKREIFDIGIAGPLAGFVAALFILYYGFTHLPPLDYVNEVHERMHILPADTTNSEQIASYNLIIGDNLLFSFFKNYVAADLSRVPGNDEILHYPFLFAGFLALFFTALNLIPIGQLDGGHILYGLIGEKAQRITAPVLFTLFVLTGGVGIFSNDIIIQDFIPLSSQNDFIKFAPAYLLFLYLVFSRVFERTINNVLLATCVFTAQFLIGLMLPALQTFPGWLLFSFILGKFLGIYHPPALIEEPLDTKRKVLGWISFIIFIICFSPNPIRIE